MINVFLHQVQTSCGYGVPQLSLTFDPETHDPKPYLKDRETLGHFGRNKVEKGQLREYQQQWNSQSLDGLPGLQSAQKDNGQWVWVGRLRNWIRCHRGEVEMVKTSVLLLFVMMVVLQWLEWF